MEFLLGMYQNKEIFIFNDTEIRFGLGDMALLSVLNVGSFVMRKTYVEFLLSEIIFLLEFDR